MNAAERIEAIRQSHAFEAAMSILTRDYERINDETIALTEIAAPPFKETAKGEAFRNLLEASGIAGTAPDEEGNIIGLRKGAGRSLIAIASHLDTVFAEDTDVRVRRDGNVLRAPGVADNTRGLAVMLALVRAMNETKIETASDLLFVGSVGEEGLGDLRGMKHLFLKGAWRDRIDAFIAIDGSDPNLIINAAVGSRRYRLVFTGPGGHSYSAFGTVNPAFALGGFLSSFGSIEAKAGDSYSVGVIGGGASVNAIPLRVFADIDTRSKNPQQLASFEAAVWDMAKAAADAENMRRSTANGKIEARIEVIGDRPAGPAPETRHRNDELSALALAASKAQGFEPRLEASSTDANIAMSLGIPAITIPSGIGGRTHTLDEWLDVRKDVNLRQLGATLAVIFAAAGVKIENIV